MTSSLEVKYGSAAMHEELSERARLIEVLEFLVIQGSKHYSVSLVNGSFHFRFYPVDRGAAVLFAKSRYFEVSSHNSGDLVLHLKYHHDFLRDWHGTNEC